MASYRAALLAELSQARFADHEGNYDHELGEEPPRGPSLLQTCLSEARQAMSAVIEPLARAAFYHLAPARYFERYAKPEMDRGEYLYRRLADEDSRRLLLKLVAFKVLGHRKVKLPRNTPEYWATLAGIGQYRTDAPPTKIKFMDASLAVYDVKPLGYDLRLCGSGVGLAYALCQKQYEYHRGDVHCKAEAGDVVIDAGACWGETSMYFAHEAGPQGACVAFEFIPSNLDVLKRNIALNPHIASRLTVVARPLWDVSGKELFYVDWGPGSRVSDNPRAYNPPDGRTSTITIEQALREAGLDRVDFIKMDIEGAELNALKGAEAAIRKHRPKLAISLYHRPDDFDEIPRWIDGLQLDYDFYLDHHTLYQNETVLFGVPRPWVIGDADALLTAGRLPEAEARYREIAAERPASDQAMIARERLIDLLESQGLQAEADAIVAEALRRRPDSADWRYRQALVLLRTGRYAEAWPLYEARRALSRDPVVPPRLSTPEWRGGPVQRLLVLQEHPSSMILFSRYLPVLRARGIHVIVACRPQLAQLLAPLVDEVLVLDGRVEVPDNDAWVLIGSLPGLLGATADNIPPSALAIPPGGDGRGVISNSAWREGAPLPDEAARALAGLPGAVNLDAVMAGIQDFSTKTHALSAVAELVAVNSAEAHLAASLGRAVTVVLPRAGADWRWAAPGGRNPWYPNATGVGPADPLVG